MLSRWVILIVVCGTSPALAGDWPQWLGPNRDGGTTETVAVWKADPKIAWRHPIGPGYSAPVIVDGRVFMHARVADKDEEEIVAYDAKTGDVKWRESYARPVYYSGLNTGPQATPTVVGGNVYTYGVNGILSCTSAESGKRVWQVNTTKLMSTKIPRYGVCCSPLVIGNRVIVSVGGQGSSIVAFDTETGEVEWQGFDDPASTASPVLFSLPRSSGQGLPDVVFMTSLRLVAVNPLDGKVHWEYPMTFRPAGTSPTPLVVGDQMITSTMTNGSTAIRIRAVNDKLTASQEWQRSELAAYFSSGAASADGKLYLITNTLMPIPKAALNCVDLKTGKELWKKDGIGYFHAGIIRLGDGKLLILDDSGLLRLAEENEQGYHELCSSRVSGGTLIVPALSNGHVYVRDDKEIICVSLAP